MTTNRFVVLIAASLLVLALASASIANAAVVTLQCDIAHAVFSAGNSAGVVLPASVVTGGPCAQAISDLLAAGFKQKAAFNVQQSTSGFAGPYYEFVTENNDN